MFDWSVQILLVSLYRSYESYFLAMSKKLWAIQKLSNEFVATGLHPTKFGEILEVVMPSLSYAYPGCTSTIHHVKSIIILIFSIELI